VRADRFVPRRNPIPSGGIIGADGLIVRADGIVLRRAERLKLKRLRRAD
jgi:hypothetical protein